MTSANFQLRAAAILKDLQIAAAQLDADERNVGQILFNIHKDAYYRAWGFTSFAGWLKTKPMGIAVARGYYLIGIYKLTLKVPALKSVGRGTMRVLVAEERKNPANAARLIQRVLDNPGTPIADVVAARVGGTRRVQKNVLLTPAQAIVWDAAVRQSSKGRNVSEADAVIDALRDYLKFCS